MQIMCNKCLEWDTVLFMFIFDGEKKNYPSIITDSNNLDNDDYSLIKLLIKSNWLLLLPPPLLHPKNEKKNLNATQILVIW